MLTRRTAPLYLIACAALAAPASHAVAQNFTFTCSINADGLLVDAAGNFVDATEPCFPAELEGVIGTTGPDGTPNTSGGGTDPTGLEPGDGSDSGDDGGTDDEADGEEAEGDDADTPTPDDTDDGNEFSYQGTVVIAGAMNGSGAKSFSVLRLTSLDEQGGVIQIAAVDPASGAILSIWSNDDMEPFSARQVSVASIFGGFSPAGLPMPSVIDLRISATFNGAVQHLIGTANDGLLVNASACGVNVIAPDKIPFIPADTTLVQSWVRIVNTGEEDVAADVSIRDADTGLPAAIWISEPVPAGGSLTVPAATIREQAAFDAGLPGLGNIMIEPATFAETLRLELVATSALTGTIADQSISCILPDISEE